MRNSDFYGAANVYSGLPNGRFIRTIVKFRKAANVTHRRYGRRSQIADVEYRATASIIAMIESHRNGTSIKAQSGRFSVKKSGLQSMCRTMLMPKRTTIKTCPEPSARVHAKTPDHAAKPRIIVQAGPKIQLGGFHEGLRRYRYQGPTVVIHPPTARTISVVIIATMIGMAKL